MGVFDESLERSKRIVEASSFREVLSLVRSVIEKFREEVESLDEAKVQRLLEDEEALVYPADWLYEALLTPLEEYINVTGDEQALPLLEALRDLGISSFASEIVQKTPSRILALLADLAEKLPGVVSQVAEPEVDMADQSSEEPSPFETLRELPERASLISNFSDSLDTLLASLEDIPYTYPEVVDAARRLASLYNDIRSQIADWYSRRRQAAREDVEALERDVSSLLTLFPPISEEEVANDPLDVLDRISRFAVALAQLSRGATPSLNLLSEPGSSLGASPVPSAEQIIGRTLSRWQSQLAEGKLTPENVLSLAARFGALLGLVSRTSKAKDSTQEAALQYLEALPQLINSPPEQASQALSNWLSSFAEAVGSEQPKETPKPGPSEEPFEIKPPETPEDLILVEPAEEETFDVDLTYEEPGEPSPKEFTPTRTPDIFRFVDFGTFLRMNPSLREAPRAQQEQAYERARRRWLEERPVRQNKEKLDAALRPPSFIEKLQNIYSNRIAEWTLPSEKTLEDIGRHINEASSIFYNYRRAWDSLSPDQKANVIYQSATHAAEALDELLAIPEYQDFVKAALDLVRSPDIASSLEEQGQTLDQLLRSLRQFYHLAQKDINFARQALEENKLYRRFQPVWVTAQDPVRLDVEHTYPGQVLNVYLGDNYEPVYEVEYWSQYQEEVPWDNIEVLPEEPSEAPLIPSPGQLAREYWSFFSSPGRALRRILTMKTAQLNPSQVEALEAQLASDRAAVEELASRLAGEPSVDIESFRNEVYPYLERLQRAATDLGYALDPGLTLEASPYELLQGLLTSYEALQQLLESWREQQPEVPLAPGQRVRVSTSKGDFFGTVIEVYPDRQTALVEYRAVNRGEFPPSKIEPREELEEAEGTPLEPLLEMEPPTAMKKAALDDLAEALIKEVATLGLRPSTLSTALLKLQRAAEWLRLVGKDSTPVDRVIELLSQGDILGAQKELEGLILNSPPAMKRGLLAEASLFDWEIDLLLEALERGDEDIIRAVLQNELIERHRSWERSDGPHQYYYEEDLGALPAVERESPLVGDERGSQFLMTLRNW